MKKQFQKILAWMVCLCLLTSLSWTALADSTVEVSTKATFTIDTVEETDVVQVDISLAEENTYMGALMIDFEYDETYLEIIKSPYNGEFFTVTEELEEEYTSWAANEKNMKIALAKAYGLKEAGVFVTVYFRVIRDIPENEIAEISGVFGNYPITALIGQQIEYDATIINGGVVGTAAEPGNKHFGQQETGIEAIVPPKDRVHNADFVTERTGDTGGKTVYDICFKEGENEIQPDGRVVVRVPVPEGYEGSECHVYRTEEDGSKTDMLVACHGDYLTFETDHFSEYTVTEEILPSTPISFPLETLLLCGDIDGDGIINAADALKALQHAVKLIELAGDQAVIADVQADGKIDAADALFILQYAVKLIDKLPGQKA